MKKVSTLLLAIMIFGICSTTTLHALSITGNQFEDGVAYTTYYQQKIDGDLPQAYLEDDYLDGTLGGTGWIFEDATESATFSMWYTANGPEIQILNNYNLTWTDFGGFHWAPANFTFTGINVSEITQLRAIVTQGETSMENIILRYTPPAPVPEPATMLLFGLGLISLAGISRKTLTNK